jgi:tetratricopeptide (TPR) repeat protein
LAGWPKIGFNHAKISLKLANQVGHHHIAVTAYLASSLALYFMADYDRASMYNEAGIEIAKKLHANRMLGYLFACQAFIENSKGNLDYGYALSDEILKIGDKFNYTELNSLAHRIRGDIYLFLESYIQSLEEYKLGVEPGRIDFWSLDNYVRQGYMEVRTGQIEIGKENILRGINLAQSTGFGMVEIRGLQFLSFAYTASNENQLTLQLTKKLEEAALERNLPEVSVLANLMSISAGSNQKNHESKIESLEHSLMILGDSGQIYVQLRILLLILMLKRNLGLDSANEVNRISEILNHCAKYASSPNLIGPFENLQKRILNLVST